MNKQPHIFAARLLAITLVASFLVIPTFGTCGGGGGGGMGGIAPGGEATVYHVPWTVVGLGQSQPPGDLVVYWFPASVAQVQGSDLRTSRNLAIWSSQCIGVGLVPDENTQLKDHFKVVETPLAILATQDGAEIRRAGPEDGRLQAQSVEKMVETELRKREDAVRDSLKTAKAMAKKGDEEGAADLYTKIAEQGCLFPGPGRKAAKALRKMGRSAPEIAALNFPTPDLRPETTSEVERLMEAGLAAERAEQPDDARRLYEQAHKLDPADPVILRFLGELHRHHTGDWQKARAIFNRLLEMPADRLSRAVALHGLGKMTIHSGDFSLGVAKFEASLEEHPLALTYRNLAVFWNSEGEPKKAFGFVQKAIEIDPEDPYNQIFAATYLIEQGKPEEALRIAQHHHDLLAASYNLAAIYAQLGERERALEFLHRHFYVYEHHDAVRAKEMREARDDIVFKPYHQDPEFVELTALADKNEDSYHFTGTR
jgi:tetratricopeptide (TPR) repeat protein